MRTKSVLLAGIAAIAVAGFCGLAAAHGPAVHVLTISLHGGGVEQIRYTGDTAPQVDLQPGSPFAAFAPFPAFFWPSAEFATLERVSAQMNRQMATMLQQANSMASHSISDPGLTQAWFGNAPRGSTSVSHVSTMSGNHVCTRMVRIVAPENGGKPQIVDRSSGDCAAGGNASPANASRMPDAQTTETGAHTSPRHLLQEASALQPG